MIKKSTHKYGEESFTISPKFTPAQKYALRLLRAKCRKALIEIGYENPTDDDIYEVMIEGDFMNDLMKIVHFGQDTSIVDFSKVDYGLTFVAIEKFFEIVKKKLLVKVDASKK